MGSIIIAILPNRSGDKIEIDMIMLCQKGIYVNRRIKIIQDGYLVTKKVRIWCEILKGKKYCFL